MNFDKNNAPLSPPPALPPPPAYEEEKAPGGPPKMTTTQLPGGVLEINVAANPDGAGARRPCDLTLVIDRSGSMRAESTLQNAECVSEKSGLMVMDVVKHAARSIVAMLQHPEDRVAIVSFSHIACVSYALGAADERANQAIEALEPGGRTNLWGGLSLAYDQYTVHADGTRTRAVVLLTDGDPNQRPPSGEVAMQARTLKRRERLLGDLQLHTIAFGYQLESALLHSLAKQGSGTFNFISDPGMVGTTFINLGANILATAYPPGLSVQGAGEHLGALSFGARVFVVCEGDGHVRDSSGAVVSEPGVPEEAPGAASAATAHHRQLLLNLLEPFCGRKDLRVLPATIAADLAEALRCVPADSPIFQDLSGQVSEALATPQAFQKWGRHYLRALSDAHAYQICNNFRDPGVQGYGSQLVRALRESGEDEFLRIDPPTTHEIRTQGRDGQVRVQAAAAADMSLYYNADAGCFDGSTRLRTTEAGGSALVSTLRRGDIVLTPAGPARVLVVAVVPCYRGTLLQMDASLTVTEYHPVNHGRGWRFPCRVSHAEVPSVRAVGALGAPVYNLVLDRVHVVVSASGVHCVTLGHGLQNDPVTAHPFFGSEDVVMNLMQSPMWISGHVVIYGVRRQAPTTPDGAPGVVMGYILEPRGAEDCGPSETKLDE